MPDGTVVCFRLVFFFSFFGRIVSELGFVLRLAFDSSFFVVGATETCGIDVTVSVSTVIFCTVPAVGLPLEPVALPDMLDWREVKGGGTLDIGGRRSAPPLMLPLSLPLSFVVVVRFALASSVLDGPCSTPSGWEPNSPISLS